MSSKKSGKKSFILILFLIVIFSVVSFFMFGRNSQDSDVDKEATSQQEIESNTTQDNTEASTENETQVSVDEFPVVVPDPSVTEEATTKEETTTEVATTEPTTEKETTTKPAIVADEEISEMVWVTKTGKKYHCISDCGNSKTSSQISLSSAKSRGYEPCSKCY